MVVVQLKTTVCVRLNSRPYAPPRPAYNGRFGLPRTRVRGFISLNHQGVGWGWLNRTICLCTVGRLLHRSGEGAGG